MPNIDASTVEGFGYEWKRFDQSGTDEKELTEIWNRYFSIFPWNDLKMECAVGADFGCGTGRWSKLVASRVGHVHLVDASDAALNVAKEKLKSLSNISFHLGSVEEVSLEEASLDFAFSLGVLHHVPDIKKALKDIAGKLKPGAPFLVYLYYNFENRPKWYATLWKTSDLGRKVICRLPLRVRLAISTLVASLVYWPLARIAGLLSFVNCLPASFPLSFYQGRSFYVMRNDALDRLGTKVEQRFSKKQIYDLLSASGFENIQFSDTAPFWCSVARKKGTV
jgi:SAM-dependent methyltransferase